MDLKKLREEYNSQDSAGTAWPIKIVVKSLHDIGAHENHRNIACDKFIPVCRHKEYHPEFTEVTQDVHDAISNGMAEEYSCHNLDAMIVNEQDCEIEYAYQCWKYTEVPSSPFMTMSAAEEYMERDAHNLYNPVAQVTHIDHRNHELMAFYNELGLRTENKWPK